MIQKNFLKPLTKEAVRKAAIRLMERNYGATIQEVKQLLRAKNYWAIQISISRWMDEIAEEEDWYFVNINHQRNYFRSEITANYYMSMSMDEMDYFLTNIKFSMN